MMADAQQTIYIQAHRGAGAARPENTLGSCLFTWSLSPRLIPELDISTTADGVIVGFHDEALTRLVANPDPSLAGKTLHDLTWEEARLLDVGGLMGPRFAGQRMVRVADAFAEMAKDAQRQLYLDYKNASLDELARLAREYRVEKRVILATNSHERIMEWRRIMPGSQTLLWVTNHGAGVPEAIIDRARRTNFEGITQLQIHTSVHGGGSFYPSAATIERLAVELRDKGIVLQAFPYTGRFAGYCEPDAFIRLLELGVRSFATDYPLDALRAVDGFLARRRDMTLADIEQQGNNA